MIITFNPHKAAVTLDVVGGDWPSPVASVKIERDSGHGWELVRGGETTVNSGFLYLSDVEMPLYTTVNYRVQGFNSAGMLTATLTGSVNTNVSGCGVFIKKAGDPNATIHADIILDALSVQTKTIGGTYEVIGGRSIAVAAASGFSADTLSLPIRVQTTEQRRAAEALFKSTPFLLFQPCDHEPFEAGWFNVGERTSGLRGGGQLLEGREYTLQLTRIDAPDGASAGVLGMTCLQLVSEYATCADVLVAFQTCADVVRG